MKRREKIPVLYGKCVCRQPSLCLRKYILKFLQKLFICQQICHGRRYRFDLVVSELRTADTVTYQTTLMAFINCLILGQQEVSQRNNLRNELFG